MFSYHENKSEIPAHYADGWREKRIYNANDLAKLVNEFAVSPCIWTQGIRGKKQFKLSEWVGLDFDEGLTLDDAMRKFGDYLHVIGTTRSHGIDKGGKVCDRFRVFIKLNDVCENVHDYEYTVKLLINKYGADKHCYDGGRLFFRCRKIVQVEIGGKVLPISKAPKSELKKQENIRKKNERLESFYKPYKIIPPRARKLLDRGCSNGERNGKCYSVGCELFRVGYSFDEVVDLLWNSAIPLDGSDDTYKDVLKAVSSARKSV